MDFLNVVVNFLSAAVIVYGGGMAAGGLMTFGEGKKQNNPGKQDEGINGAIGGGIIICVGLFLIPKIATLFPTA
mgnify:FL=1